MGSQELWGVPIFSQNITPSKLSLGDSKQALVCTTQSQEPEEDVLSREDSPALAQMCAARALRLPQQQHHPCRTSNSLWPPHMSNLIVCLLVLHR